MSATAKRSLVDVESDPINQIAALRLCRELSNGARHGAGSAIVGTRAALSWNALENAIVMVHDGAVSPADFDQARTTLAARAAKEMARRREGKSRTAAYQSTASYLADHRHGWMILLPERILAQELSRAMRWHTAWHLLEAGVAIDWVIKLLRREAPRSVSAPPPLRRHLRILSGATFKQAAAWARRGTAVLAKIAGQGLGRAQAGPERAREARAKVVDIALTTFQQVEQDVEQQMQVVSVSDACEQPVDAPVSSPLLAKR